MIEITNKAKFEQIVSDAIEKVAMTVPNDKLAQRWINAINKAAAQIEENGEWITWMPETKSIVIWNQETNNVHSANGVCDCMAFQKGFPCFHRAAARIIRLYMEAEEAKKESPALTYLPVTVPNPRRMKIAGVWID
ncbi:MAG TPA: hypothetical protein VK892_11475 [Pyrinomonadaceae bacterium]|nr:hypothetical protein [Pyrinomonadaceae bacterium]